MRLFRKPRRTELRLVAPTDSELQRLYWATAAEIRELLRGDRAARRPAA